MTSLIFPIFTSIFHIAVCIYWAATAAYIASSSTPVFRVLDSSNQTENSLPVYGESCDINEWDAPTHPEFNNTQELDLKIFRWRCCVAIGGAILFCNRKINR